MMAGLKLTLELQCELGKIVVGLIRALANLKLRLEVQYDLSKLIIGLLSALVAIPPLIGFPY
jgi:hypothetical protein